MGRSGHQGWRMGWVAYAVCVVCCWLGAAAHAPAKPSGEAQNAQLNDDAVITLIGEVLLTKGAPGRAQVVVHHDERDTVLLGPMQDELARLQAMRVEVIGRTHGQGNVWVLGYRILDIGGGIKPLVGIVIAIGREFALQDGDGAPIVLSASPRYRKQLERDVGSKIWIHGKKLLSGTLHVVRYGVLRRDGAEHRDDNRVTPQTETPRGYDDDAHQGSGNSRKSHGDIDSGSNAVRQSAPN